MATLQGILSVTIADADEEKFAVPFSIFPDDGATLADFDTAMSTFLPLLDAVIDGYIVKAVLHIDLVMPGGLKGSAVAGSETERTGLYSFTVAGSPFVYSIDIPAMSLDTLVAGSNKIDPANSDVDALVAALKTATAPLKFADKYGNILAELKSAQKTFRKHRKSTKLH